MALNHRQKAFVAAYAGNGTEAARKAGYTGTPGTLAVTAHHLLRNPKIRDGIAARSDATLERLTLTREELQQAWSELALDPSVDPPTRLAAMRDLAKSQGVFIERHQHSVGKTLDELIAEATALEAKK